MRTGPGRYNRGRVFHGQVSEGCSDEESGSKYYHRGFYNGELYHNIEANKLDSVTAIPQLYNLWLVSIVSNIQVDLHFRGSIVLETSPRVVE